MASRIGATQILTVARPDKAAIRELSEPPLRLRRSGIVQSMRIVCAITMLFLCHASFAASVRLSDGSLLHGQVVSQTSEHLVLNSPLLGEIRVPLAHIAKAPKKTAARPKDLWSFEVAAGVNGKSAQSQYDQFKGSFRFTRQGRQGNAKGYLRATYASRDERTVNEEFLGGLDFSSRFTERQSFYVRNETETDRVARLTLRNTSGLGYGRFLWKDKPSSLEARIGGLWQYEMFEDRGDASDPGLDLGLFYSQRWENRSKLASTLRYTPLLAGKNHLRLEFNNRLDMPMRNDGALKLRLQLRNLYSDLTRELETSYNTQLVYSF